MLPQPIDATLLTLEHWVQPAVIPLRSLYRCRNRTLSSSSGSATVTQKSPGGLCLLSPCFSSLSWEGTKGDVSICLDRWGESLCWDKPCSPSGAYHEYLYSKSKHVVLDVISQGCFPPGTCFPRWAVINTLCYFIKVFWRYKYLGRSIISLLKQNSRLFLVTSQFFSAYDCF